MLIARSLPIVAASAFVSALVFGAPLNADDTSRPTVETAINQLRIEGANTFSEESIRTSLKEQPHLKLRRDEAAKMDRIRGIAIKHVQDGYVSSGFLDAAVEGIVEDAGLRLRITEGPRYTKGKIVIEGLTPEESLELQNALSMNAVDHQSAVLEANDKISTRYLAVWRSGAAVADQKSAITLANTLVQSWLTDHGYSFARTDVTISRSPETSTIELRVQIDKGAKTQISEVQFEGLDRHTSEEVLKYLDLPTVLNDSEMTRRMIRNRLLASGRFYSVDVWPEAPFLPEQAVPLHVRVHECLSLPRLSEALNEEQQAIVNLGNWLSQWHQSGEDLVASLKLYAIVRDKAPAFSVTSIMNQLIWATPSPEVSTISMLISPQGLAAMTVSSVNTDGSKGGLRTAWIGQGEAGIHFGESNRSFCLQNFDIGLAVAALFRTGELNPNGEMTTRFDSGFKMNTGRRPAFAFELSFPPAVLLSSLESIRKIDERTYELILRADGTIVQFDAQSGRLLQLWHMDEDDEIIASPQKHAVQAVISSIKATSHRDAIKDEVLLPFVRFLFLQYADGLARWGNHDEAAIISTLLEGKHWDEFQSALTEHDSREAFPGASTTPSMPVNLMNPLESLTQQGIAEGRNWVRGEHVVADTIQDSLTDQQAVELIESIFEEHPQSIAFFNYLTGSLRSLSSSATERLAVVLETGEFATIGRGWNARPLFQIVRTDATNDPKEIRRRLIEFAWTLYLKKNLQIEVVQVKDEKRVRWSLSANATGTGDAGWTSARFLNSTFEQLVPGTEALIQAPKPPELKNPFLPVSSQTPK